MTLVERQVSALRRSGLNDIVVVVGCEAERVRRSCGRGVQFVDDLPKTATGKLQRFKLREASPR